MIKTHNEHESCFELNFINRNTNSEYSIYSNIPNHFDEYQLIFILQNHFNNELHVANWTRYSKPKNCIIQFAMYFIALVFVSWLNIFLDGFELFCIFFLCVQLCPSHRGNSNNSTRSQLDVLLCSLDTDKCILLVTLCIPFWILVFS